MKSEGSRLIFGVITIAVVLLLLVAIFSWLEANAIELFGLDQLEESPTYETPLWVSIGTVLGIWSKSLYDVVTQNTSTTQTLWSVLSASFQVPTLVLSIIVAPVIIGVFYGNIRSQPDLFFSFVVAYQNGFFWKTVLSRF